MIAPKCAGATHNGCGPIVVYGDPLVTFTAEDAEALRRAMHAWRQSQAYDAGKAAGIVDKRGES